MNRCAGGDSGRQLNEHAGDSGSRTEAVCVTGLIADETHASITACQPETRSSRLALFASRFIYGLHMRRLHELFFRPEAVSLEKDAVWLLGVKYDVPNEGSEVSTSASTDFMHDFESRIWITYRKDFQPIGESMLTSDVGWGCMIRSGQMLLAQALLCRRLGRKWRKGQGKEYLEILKFFLDFPDEKFLFSIHNIIEAGKCHGVNDGAWLGPYKLCRAIESLCKEPGPQLVLQMVVHVVAGDADGQMGGVPMLCIEDIENLCRKGAGETTEDMRDDSDRQEAKVGTLFYPILILVPLVLGVDEINPRYLSSIRATFQFPQSVGILGGKPGASTYIVGIQDESALVLDPHEVQKVMAKPSEDNLHLFDASSYHCSVVRRIPLHSIDPTLALGFFCRDESDFQDFCSRASELIVESGGAPIFTVGSRECQASSNINVDLNMDENVQQKMEENEEADEEWQIV